MLVYKAITNVLVVGTEEFIIKSFRESFCRERKTVKVLATPAGDIFLERDVELLRKHFEVRTVPTFNRKRPIATLPNVFRIFNGVLWADVTFSQFADTHAFFAVVFSKVLRKKSIVVVGGYEVAKVPEIKYGAMLNPMFRQVVGFILRHADKVLTTSDSLRKDTIANARVNGKNIETVPECYDSEQWKLSSDKEDIVMTVASITNNTVIKRKGLDTFIKAASHFPDVKFIIIGDNTNGLQAGSAPNVEFPGFISSKDLPKWYSRAKVYCQLSLYEGIPNALCEAMLCECVPIGTHNCGIPTAMGETGYYVSYGNVEATVKAINEALNSGKGKEARRRIKGMFPIERRERELVRELRTL